MTGASYVSTLDNDFWPLVQNNDSLYFQQDGASPHYSLVACEWLNEKFPGRWIGRRGPTEWPSRSPDLSPLDFFLWGVLKDKVYSRKPKTTETLKNVIIEEIENINNDKELCEKVCRSVGHRLKKCIELEGRQVEPYL